MKTLLTGGAGYIGSHTAVAMLEAGHEVAVVDNYVNSSAEAISRVEKITGKKVSLYEADVADRESMMEILQAEMPDCISHRVWRGPHPSIHRGRDKGHVHQSVRLDQVDAGADVDRRAVLERGRRRECQHGQRMEGAAVGSTAEVLQSCGRS